MSQSATSPELTRIAAALRGSVGASRILLFGSHARGTAWPDSDVDLIVVAERIGEVERARRAVGLRNLWYAAGGDAPMDLICLMPDAFDLARERISLVAAVLPETVEL